MSVKRLGTALSLPLLSNRSMVIAHYEYSCHCIPLATNLLENYVMARNC
ncbi:hypothetical protein ZEAMMB73_Zm00001d037393 [Zea mays]|nr:hypothetical protein ZEAMMB73_Zm00001d037393 [Zea mays]